MTAPTWKMIGQGATAKVYCSESPGLKSVAIKVMNDAYVYHGMQEILAHWLIESNDFIVRLYSHRTRFILGANRLCLTYELMGNSLDRYMNACVYADYIPVNIPKSTIKRFMHQLCSALAACHRVGIVHRDIKPDNILLDANNKNVKLADFGLSKVCDPDGFIPNVHTVFRLQYRAPEILLCAPMYSSSVDIWALGCIFGQLARGSLLFDGLHEAKIMSKIFGLLGLPNESSWPGVSGLLEKAKWLERIHCRPIPLNLLVQSLDESGCDLLAVS